MFHQWMQAEVLCVRSASLSTLLEAVLVTGKTNQQLACRNQL